MSETATYDTSIAQWCYPSSDPWCPRPTTQPLPNCYPGSSDPRCPKPTPSKPVCYPGSPDPSCPQPPRPTTLTPPTYLPPTTIGPKCYPGSTDLSETYNNFFTKLFPRCVQTQGVPRLRRRSLLNVSLDLTIPDAPDRHLNNCTPNCYPGSIDPGALK
ncbi:hypothetical protein EVAR_46044_1 [Eumeta japonica]|uniref:Uncharacterized protein n=1 Tax=Eumeta variegata TaxID=151549 RepID=A0A4C1XIK8_EUMVA|nr:hypothetical protein EVAR_46044_1 [Eumeta japonica]